MNKIRINELARELEVKAHEIIDRLPELGVTEKKTHSSSIDEDVAIKLRRLLGLHVPTEDAEPESRAVATPHEQPAAAVEQVLRAGGCAERPAWARFRPSKRRLPNRLSRRLCRIDRRAARRILSVRHWRAARRRPFSPHRPRRRLHLRLPPPPRTRRPTPRTRAHAPRGGDCARSSDAARGPAGSAAAARPGPIRTAPADAGGRQRTALSVGADFQQARRGRASTYRAIVGSQSRRTRVPGAPIAVRAQTARPGRSPGSPPRVP